MKSGNRVGIQLISNSKRKMTMTDWLKLQITTMDPAPNPMLDILMVMWELPVTIAGKVFRLYHRHKCAYEARREAITGS